MKQGELSRYCAELMAGEPERVFRDEEIAEILNEEVGSKECGFAWMNCAQVLKDEYSYWSIRISFFDEDQNVFVKGYRAATDEEKIKVLTERKWRRVESHLLDQKAMLSSVKNEALDNEQSKALESNIIKSGFAQLAVSHIRRTKKMEAAMEMHLLDPKPLKMILQTRKEAVQDEQNNNEKSQD